jgi:hypothetical protein
MLIENPNAQQGVIPPLEQAMMQEETPKMMPIGEKQVQELTQILQKYKAGKARTEQRIIASENWWKLRNSAEEMSKFNLMSGKFTSKSGWLHNVITSKHSDAMSAYPEAVIQARESGDKGEAQMLSAIIPCVLEQNNFESTYNDAMWSKMKSGTGVYKVVWDSGKHNGIGDISVEPVNLLNIYWEPGIKDIQKSRYFFHTELWDKDILQEMYPMELAEGLKGNAFVSSKFLYDDHVDTENKVTVIECYYHKFVGGKQTLQYVKYVGDKVLYATENMIEPMVDARGQQKPPLAVSGLYDHGKYPYVFDALFPIEGSPCGYGFVDLGQAAQTEIDMMKTSMVINARVGAIPRYFSSTDSGLNEEELMDLSKPIVHLNNVREDALRLVDHKGIDGSYMNLLQWDVNELRETTGNTETSTGSTSSGVTAASAIAALQEASGKGSRDATKSAYRAYTKIVELCIELIRQFYDLPRKFRILGQYGAERYISYTNAGIQPQAQGNAFGQDMGMRLPVFDIKVSAQKQNVYTSAAYNELSLQLYKSGFFSPSNSHMALMALEMMDFEGKDELMQKIAQNGTIFDKLVQYMQLSLLLAQKGAPEYVEQIAMDMQATTGQAPQIRGGSTSLPQGDNITGAGQKENKIVANARERSAAASQPQ